MSLGNLVLLIGPIVGTAELGGNPPAGVVRDMPASTCSTFVIAANKTL